MRMFDPGKRPPRGSLRHIHPADDIWAPDLSRRSDVESRRQIDRDTEEMLRDWRAARATAGG